MRTLLVIAAIAFLVYAAGLQGMLRALDSLDTAARAALPGMLDGLETADRGIKAAYRGAQDALRDADAPRGGSGQ